MSTNNYLRVVAPRDLDGCSEIGIFFFDDRDREACAEAINRARSLARGRRDRVIAYRGSIERAGGSLRFKAGSREVGGPYDVNGLVGVSSSTKADE